MFSDILPADGNRRLLLESRSYLTSLEKSIKARQRGASAVGPQRLESYLATVTEALYWGVAAFSTAGIAEAPRGGLSQLIAGVWSILGSILFFGTIVATVTAYFMRPLQRPAHQIVDTIEYNLEQLEDLSLEELELLKHTTDALIEHVERLKQQSGEGSER